MCLKVESEVALLFRVSLFFGFFFFSLLKTLLEGRKEKERKGKNSIYHLYCSG